MLNLNTRLNKLEQQFYNPEIIRGWVNRILDGQEQPGDEAITRWFIKQAPPHIRRMSNAQLIAYLRDDSYLKSLSDSELLVLEAALEKFSRGEPITAEETKLLEGWK